MFCQNKKPFITGIQMDDTKQKANFKGLIIVAFLDKEEILITAFDQHLISNNQKYRQCSITKRSPEIGVQTGGLQFAFMILPTTTHPKRFHSVLHPLNSNHALVM